MSLGARRARDLAVSNVAHEHMAEFVLGFSRHGASPLATYEVLPCEAAKALLDLREFSTADRSQRRRPEHLAEHRGVLQERLLVRRQRVKSSGDDPLDVLGQLETDSVAALCKHPHVLLSVERIAACAFEQLSLNVCGQHWTIEQRCDKACRLRLIERRERDGHGIPFAASPSGSTVEELWPRGAEHE